MERIFYQSDVVDAYTGHPIFVFDTSYLPPTSQIDYDLFIPTMMKSLPDRPYVLIMFSCGLNKINWLWGVKFLKAFLSPDLQNRDNVGNLTKVISVHESWFVKSISQILTNISFSRQTLTKLNSLFGNKSSKNNILISCDSLSELSYYVDITKLKLSLNIYKHDAQCTLSPKIELNCPLEPILTPSTRYSQTSDPVFYHHFYQIFRIVDMYGPNVELIFHRPGNRLNTEILFLCIVRNQLIWINDWDLNCIASCFKKLLLEVSQPLIPVDKIPLPMNDLLNYTLEVLNVMMADPDTNVLTYQIMDLCYRIVENAAITNHSHYSILKSMCHALTHELLSTQNRDRISIGTRFIKNVLLHWERIRPLYQNRFESVEQIVNGETLHNPAIDELYNMSHEITMNEDESTDEETRDFSTKMILDDTREPSGHINEKNEYFKNKKVSSLEKAREISQKVESVREMERQQVEKKNENEGRQTGKIRNEKEGVPDEPQEEHSTTDTKRDETLKFTKISNPGKRVPKRCETIQEEKLQPNQLKGNNVMLQYPPQKYRFERTQKNDIEHTDAQVPEPKPIKKPVIRGRKVSELTRLFEERTQAFEIIRTI